MDVRNGILWEQKFSIDQENFLKFEAEGQEFANILRSLEKLLERLGRQSLSKFDICIPNFKATLFFAWLFI